jgi:DNA mismatch repair protein MutS2
VPGRLDVPDGGGRGTGVWRPDRRLRSQLTSSLPHKTLDDLGWPRLVAALAQRAATARGQERCRGLLPSLDAAAAGAVLDAAEELRAAAAERDSPPLGGIADLRAALARVEKEGVLEGVDLVAVAATARALARLGRWLRAGREKRLALAARAGRVADLVPLAARIESCFDERAALRDDASEALAGLRAEVAGMHERVRARIQSYLVDPALEPLLQDKFWTVRAERYVLPVKVEERRKVPGIVHDTSQTGATAFVEPEAVVELNNRLKIAAADVAREERRILAELSARVAAEAADLEEAAGAAEEVDALWARARLADELGATRPRVAAAQDDDRLELPGARHALLVLGGADVVANDLAVGGAARALVVSGPNAGGKTIALKTIGLAALMVRAGLAVPARAGAQVPVFDHVLSDIGDEQDLERDLSTFSARLLNLQRALGAARTGMLALLDELAVGTEPEQGAALAGAALEALVGRGAVVVATTHYGRVKALAAADGRMVNASFALDPERRRPTYRLTTGVPGVSSAFEIAESLGMEAAVVERARVLAGEGGGGGLERAIGSLAEERDALAATRAALEKERRALEHEREALKLKRSALDNQERKTLTGKRRELGEAIDRAAEALKRATAELRQASVSAAPGAGLGAAAGAAAGAASAAARAAIAGAKDAVRAAEAEEVPATPVGGEPLPAAEVRPGVEVQVAGLGAVGVVREVNGDRVVVEAAGKRLEARQGMLLRPPARAQRRAGTARAKVAASGGAAAGAGGAVAGAGAVLTPRSTENTLDLRGMRVEDALGELERFLDRALREQHDAVYVLHGHGTGAVKQATRDLLRRRAAWCTFRPGDPAEGGDGVTVVVLA